MWDFKMSSNTLAPSVVSIVVLGSACGSLLFAPLSEIYNHVIIYDITNVMFLYFTVLCVISLNPWMLLAFRFVSG